MSSDTHNILGLESDISVVAALVPQDLTDATPVLSSAIDTASYPRKRIVLVAKSVERTDTAYTTGFTVTESATSGGSYTAATTSGTLTAVATAQTRTATIKRNAAKPFIKITVTGSHADVDTIVSADVLFI
jgi:ArsR family metal-binding transcriptional regulator